MREMTCIGCPIGCTLMVEINGDAISVQGNGCPKGAKYAKNEVTDPRRMLTSTVAVDNGTIARLSVRTAQEIPKNKIFDCMDALKNIRTKAPVKIGNVVLENCAGTGIDVIATRNIDAL